MARKILLLITDLQIGGTPTVVRELALRLNHPTAQVHIACLAPWGPVADQIRAVGLPVTALNAAGPRDLLTLRRLHRLIAAEGFDTLLSFLIHANAAAAAVSFLHPNIRYFQSIQTTQPYPRWHWTLQGLIHPAAEKILAISPSVAHAACHWSGIPRHKIVIIPNAVDLPAFANLSRIPPTARPFPIGFIGRLDPIKRIGDLIDATHRLGDRVHLHIFGQGPQRQALQIQIASLGLGQRVTLHGAIPRPQEALAQIGLLVLPSAAEGFGLVLIEAMAAGIPVLATKVPGIRDVVQNEHTALLVPPANPARLAAAIARLIDNPALVHHLTTQATADVARRFTWESVIKQYRTLLDLPHPPLS